MIQPGLDWCNSLDDAIHTAMGATLTSIPFAFIPTSRHLAATGTMGAIYLIWLALLTLGIRERLKETEND